MHPKIYTEKIFVIENVFIVQYCLILSSCSALSIEAGGTWKNFEPPHVQTVRTQINFEPSPCIQAVGQKNFRGALWGPVTVSPRLIYRDGSEKSQGRWVTCRPLSAPRSCREIGMESPKAIKRPTMRPLEFYLVFTWTWVICHFGELYNR